MKIKFKHIEIKCFTKKHRTEEFITQIQTH